MYHSNLYSPLYNLCKLYSIWQINYRTNIPKIIKIKLIITKVKHINNNNKLLFNSVKIIVIKIFNVLINSEMKYSKMN